MNQPNHFDKAILGKAIPCLQRFQKESLKSSFYPANIPVGEVCFVKVTGSFAMVTSVWF